MSALILFYSLTTSHAKTFGNAAIKSSRSHQMIVIRLVAMDFHKVLSEHEMSFHSPRSVANPFGAPPRSYLSYVETKSKLNMV